MSKELIRDLVKDTSLKIQTAFGHSGAILTVLYRDEKSGDEEVTVYDIDELEELANVLIRHAKRVRAVLDD